MSKKIKIDMIGPNFKAVTQNLESFDFYKEAGHQIKIISSVPSLDTGVCSLQTLRFNKEAQSLKEDVVVVTISVDLPFAQKRFCSTEGIENLLVVSDHKDLDFGNKYGFVNKASRLLTRGVVVLDRDNTVRYVQYVEHSNQEPDYDKALAEVRNLLYDETLEEVEKLLYGK